MAHDMPVSNMPVKVNRPRYAYRGVEAVQHKADDAGMNNLARIRRARGLTQTQLAEAVGCNQATISKIEAGGNYTLSLADRIATALRVSAVELFGVSELEQRYLDALRNASDERRRAVLLLLEGDGAPFRE